MQLMLSGFEVLSQQYTQQLQQDNQASASQCVVMTHAVGSGGGEEEGASDCFVTKLEAQAETVALGRAGVLEHLHDIRKNRVRAVQIGNGGYGGGERDADDSCRSANDGHCDEPTYCPYGTDTSDCSGEEEEEEGGGGGGGEEAGAVHAWLRNDGVLFLTILGILTPKPLNPNLETLNSKL
jgi:hypothetical protein